MSQNNETQDNETRGCLPRSEGSKEGSGAPKAPVETISFRSVAEAMAYVGRVVIDGGADDKVMQRAAKILGREIPKRAVIQTELASLPTQIESLFEEVSITVNANNKLNIGDYSSAERGVFLGAKVKIPANLPPEERMNAILTETRKLQLMAETQLAAIAASTMARDGLNHAGWHRMFVQIFEVVRKRCLEAFGVKPAEEPQGTPQA